MDTTLNHAPLLSVVTPMYNEEAGVDAFLAALLPALSQVTDDWELVCVNDGSRDGTLAVLKAAFAADARIRYVSLSRNFGKEAALTAGLHAARGQAVIPIDADLQDPPALIPELVAKWREGYKVVLATRRTRLSDTPFKRFSARAFYRVMARVSSVAIPENTGDFRLMDRQALDAVLQLNERARFMKGLFAWVGFSTATVYFDRAPRARGTSKLSYSRLWQHAKDGIFSFTTLPLRLMGWAGVVISLISLVYAAHLVVRTLMHGADMPGYASLMTAVLFMGGVQLVSLGIIGEYIGRIYREAKQRPLFVIEEESGAENRESR